MDTPELLTTHRSASRLVEPALTGEQLQNILRVGMRTPDHKTLQPWQFFVIEGEGCERSSAVFEKGAATADSDEKIQEKVCSAPFCAPLIIVVVAKCEEDDKAPLWEREVSAGCAVMVMQMVAIVQGFGGIQYNGILAESTVARGVFDYRPQDKIADSLYPGTPQLKVSTTINLADPSTFIHYS